MVSAKKNQVSSKYFGGLGYLRLLAEGFYTKVRGLGKMLDKDQVKGLLRGPESTKIPLWFGKGLCWRIYGLPGISPFAKRMFWAPSFSMRLG